MKKWLILALLAPALATAQRYETSDGKIRVAPVEGALFRRAQRPGALGRP